LIANVKLKSRGMLIIKEVNMNNIMQRNSGFILAGLISITFAPSVTGDELILKDGSVIRGQLLKETPGQSYRLLLKDGSEMVYPSDKVESVTFGTSNAITQSQMDVVSRPVTNGNQQISKTNNAPINSTDQSLSTWGAVESTGNASELSKGWNAASSGTKENIVKPFSIGVGLGEYGLVGMKIGARPADIIGLEVGAGAYYYKVDYYKYKKKSESGFIGQVGVQEHIYFTPRTEKNQHSLNLGQYYTGVIGPSISIGYGYERHCESGIGFNFAIGFWYPVGDYKKYMADYVKVNKSDIKDVTVIPVYLELGIFF